MDSGTLLGIDGGGTKTVLLLIDRSGCRVRSSRGGGVNPMDNPGWHDELNSLLTDYVRDDGIVGIGAALPAYGEAESLSRRQREAMDTAFPDKPCVVLNDVEAAHIGAFAGQPGILILSGTGSMAWARDENGGSHRVGGWGDIIGDEGSSYWLGRLALECISQSLDGRSHETSLLQAVFEHLGLDRANALNALTGWAANLSLPRAEIAALAEIVDAEASAGDPVARHLLFRAADELAKHHAAIAPVCASDTPWTYAGGTLTSRLLRDALSDRIGSAPKPPELPPVGGALLAAAQNLGWPTDTAFVEQIAAATTAAEVPMQNKTTQTHRRRG